MGLTGTRLRRKWRKLYNEGLNDPYCSPNIIRVKNEKGEACSAYERRRNVSAGFWWENQKKRDHSGRHRHRWEDNIKMDLQEVELGAWTGLIWLRIGTGGRDVANAVTNLRVPYNAGNFWSS